MRIRVLQRPSAASVDRLWVDGSYLGRQHEVGNVLGALLLAEGSAQPVADEQPALHIPFSETSSLVERQTPSSTNAIEKQKQSQTIPSNLIHDLAPPYADPARHRCRFRARETSLSQIRFERSTRAVVGSDNLPNRTDYRLNDS
jgi:hypothetical protein